ncbi:hypothetical protein [Botrimarina sp.]|uniref:hypothetical protein n=1 Tax=Botrimarina sp. TaxID=2795802 RepID=UPI0032ECBF25
MPTSQRAAARLAAWGLVVLLGWRLPGAALADVWTDSHDEPTPVWDIDADTGARLVERKRVRQAASGAESDRGMERLVYLAPAGYAAGLWRRTPPAAVIDELAIEADLRGSSPGVALAAEIVLPYAAQQDEPAVRLAVRSEPQDTSGPRGGTVRLDRLPIRLERQARVWMLANAGRRLDTRGAYVDRVGVVAPGAGRPAEVLVDELRIESLVTPLRTSGIVDSPAENGPILPTVTDAGAGRLSPTKVTLRSDGFRVDEKSYFPRIWRWRGEPYEALAARGLNTVWLDQTASPQELAEAAHHRLRILCPPPENVEAARAGHWDRVLAWVLPGRCDPQRLDAGLAEADRVRHLPEAALRPLLAHVVEGAERWSRVVDGVLIDLADRLPSAERVPPGSPVVGLVPLELDSRATVQLDALLGEGVAATWRPPAEVAESAEASLRAGAMGVAFTASSSLSGADDATYAAAGWLETLNRRLRLIEPWLVGPRSVATDPAAQPPPATLFSRGSTRLAAIRPLRAATASGEPPRALDDGPDPAAVYRVTPAGVSDHSARSLAGGSATALPDAATPGDLLITTDARLVRSLRQYTAETGPAASRTAGLVAETTLRLCESLTPETRRLAEQRLAAWRVAASRRDYRVAYDEALRCLSFCAEADAQRRTLATDGPAAESSPLALTPATLTAHFRLAQILAASPRGPNRLEGGSFEDIDEARSHGWRRPPAADAAAVELVEADAVHGDQVLRLRGDTRAAPSIESPPLRLAPGETVEVTGWARVESASGGRLIVSDTLGGPDLTLRVGDTGGAWRPFRLLRATRADTQLQLTFTTAGAVQAEVDAVMLRAIQTPGVARRPTRTASGAAQPK